MPRRNETRPSKRPVEQYDHRGKKRLNNPPVGLVDASTDAVESKKTYAYDPHLDPQLVWAGKAERASFEVPTVSLHVHERIDPRGIIEAIRKKNGSNCLRDRLLLARELLSESGSVFVQISDDNLHHVREILDEVLGTKNSVCVVNFVKRTSATADVLSQVNDYILW